MAISIRLSRIGATWGMVLPDSLLVKEYPRTRQMFLESHSLQQVIHLSKAFENVDHDVVILLVTAKVKVNKNVIAKIIPVGQKAIEKTPSEIIPLDYWENATFDYRYNLLLSDVIQALSDKLYSKSITYEQICETHEGIHTRHRRADIFPEVIVKFTQMHKPALIGQRSGDIVERYLLDWGGRYVNYNQKLATPNKKGMKPDLVNESWFNQPKLIIVRTGEQFKTCVDRDNFYLSNNLFSSFYSMKERLNPSYEYLCSLLNSNLLQKFLRIRIAPRFGDLYVETKIKHLELLPIRRIDFTTPQTEREVSVAEFVTDYEANHLDRIMKRIPLILGANQTDVIHDLLAYLAQQMIDLNKAKQVEMSRWLAWLEAQLGASVADFSGKSFIQGYLGDYQKGEDPQPWDKIVEQLEKSKNRKLMSVNVKDKTLQGKIRVEYEASLKVLRPIKEKLKGTDDLIDLIVYQLYGLTDDEIAIVEGRV
jgi:hypothetical protein